MFNEKDRKAYTNYTNLWYMKCNKAQTSSRFLYIFLTGYGSIRDTAINQWNYRNVWEIVVFAKAENQGRKCNSCFNILIYYIE